MKNIIFYITKINLNQLLFYAVVRILKKYKFQCVVKKLCTVTRKKLINKYITV